MEQLQDKSEADTRNTLDLFFAYLKLRELSQEKPELNQPNLEESPFKEYYDLGGVLEIESLEKAAKNYSKMDQITEESIRWTDQDNNWPIDIPSLGQAESMASHSKVDITLAQKKIYIALRKTVTKYSDGEIFSQMLLLTSPQDYTQFKDSYIPHSPPELVPRKNNQVA